MSAAAMGNVWKHAEFGGSKLVVLLAVADVANDAYDNEFWMGSGKLADKCRMDPRNVRRKLKELVDEGWLIQLELGGGMGKPSRYQFVPRTETAPIDAVAEEDETGSYNPVGQVDETGSYDPVTGSDNPLYRVMEPGLPGHTARHIYNSIETQRELKELNGENQFFPSAEIEVVSDKQIVKELFDEFWNAYNHKRDRQGAVAQWNKHIKDRTMAEMVIEKARQYNAATDPGYLKLPSGWLRGKRWEDEVVGNRKMTASDETLLGLQEVARKRGLLND